MSHFWLRASHRHSVPLADLMPAGWPHPAPPHPAPHPSQVDRVIAERTRYGRRLLLVKWRGLGYAESTWEEERRLADPVDDEHVRRFERHNAALQAELQAEEDAVDEEARQSLDPTLGACGHVGVRLPAFLAATLPWMVAALYSASVPEPAPVPPPPVPQCPTSSTAASCATTSATRWSGTSATGRRAATASWATRCAPAPSYASSAATAWSIERVLAWQWT